MKTESDGSPVDCQAAEHISIFSVHTLLYTIYLIYNHMEKRWEQRSKILLQGKKLLNLIQ